MTFTIHAPDGTTRVETLEQDIVKIGKLTASHLRLDGDEEVSRIHAVIEVREGEINIIDLGSRAGTLLNGEGVNKALLHDGDELRLGQTRIVFNPPAATLPPAPPPRPACPRCQQPMIPRGEGPVTALICGGCGGLWLDPLAVGRMTDAGGAGRALRALAEDAARRAPFGGGMARFNVACPVCGKLMQRMEHARSQVVVDLCQAHGTWFDRGEVQRLVDKPRGGDGGPFRSAPQAADPAVELPVAEAPTSSTLPGEGPRSEAVSALLDLLVDW